MHRIAMIVAAAAAAPALAVVNPFVETFDADSANWRNFDSTLAAGFDPAGGPDGTGAAFVDYNFLGTAGLMFPPTVFRGETADNASNNAFTGDWLAAGITEFSFDIRHNATLPLNITGRIATGGNFPGASFVSFAPVVPGQWTTITVAIDENNPQFVSFSNQPFEDTFNNVGRIQLGVSVPAGLEGQDVTVRFEYDNIRVVPAPMTGLAFAPLALAAVRRRR